jgi:hypothetical protein
MTTILKKVILIFVYAALAVYIFDTRHPVFASNKQIQKQGQKSCNGYFLDEVSLAQVEEIRRFILSKTDVIVDELRLFQFEAAFGGNPNAVIHTDPLACRFCNGAANIIVRLLNEEKQRGNKLLTNVNWLIEYNDSPANTKFLDGYAHRFNYAPILNLIVDATYRQFLIEMNPSEFDKLPKIFIGTPEEFINLLKGKVSDDFIKAYLSSNSIKKHNPNLFAK